MTWEAAMERCKTVTKTVQECTHRHRLGYRIARCTETEITQQVCVESTTGGITDTQLEEAIRQWQSVVRVPWRIHRLFSVVYPLQSDGTLGRPAEMLWK
jgi:hypothetical protein